MSVDRLENNVDSAPAIAAPLQHAVTALEPAPVSQAEEYSPDGLVKAVPEMRLDVLIALQRK